MKKLLLCLLALGAISGSATTWKEKRTVVFPSASKGKEIVLQPNDSFTEEVSFGQADLPTRKFVRVIGGGMFGRNEDGFRNAEPRIDDNLDSVVHKNEHFSLYFKGENDNFERHAYNRIPGELLTPGELTVTLPVVKKQDLQVMEGGDFGLTIELFYKKAGRASLDVYDAPDSLLYIPVEPGSGKYQKITQSFNLPDKVACALIYVGGTHFQGECWLESPVFTQNKKKVWSMPFTRFADRTDKTNFWVGCNLSNRFWPLWKLEFNGEEIFRGNIFDRASNTADFYIQLPEHVTGKGTLKLTLLKEPHRQSFAYRMRGLDIIEEPARDYEVVAAPAYVAKDAPFGVLVETNKPGVKLSVSVEGEASPASQECVFENTGLHVVQLTAKKPGAPVKLTFNDGNRKEETQVAQVIDKEYEQIYISSGDEIYVDKQYSPYDYFFKWYISNRVGNGYHFRPSYQWSGVREVNPEVIGHYTQLLDQLEIPYAWQVEGRALAGGKINPPAKELETSMFRGKQAHENDGCYYYWWHFKHKGLISDISARKLPYGGIFAKHRPVYTDHGAYVHYDKQGVKDMADGARSFVANLRYSKGESSRHTGPSALFRYFYQAGYDWLGTEQMYGPEEVMLSSLRGASLAYSRPLYGSLHAMQWGGGPFVDPKHSLRLYMSLALSYMHGSSHINTEEALWTDEHMHDRYTESGKEHMFAQHQVLDFVETHTRRGEMTNHIAIIQGKNDAWKAHDRTNHWSQEGDKWKFDKGCESFDMLHVFYPENIMNSCGPEGWFSSTPFGTVNLLPVEAPLDVMNKHKAIIFLGWNTYDEDDFVRLKEYVFNGGTLLLSAAHLNSELQPDLPVRFPQNDAVIKEMLGDNYQKLTARTDINYGTGKIIYFPQKAYPAEDVLKEEYEKEIRTLAEKSIENESLKGWVSESPSIGFTAWDTPERRTLYLLNTDWSSEADKQVANFVYMGQRFDVDVRRYHVETLHCAYGLSVMPSSNTTDVLSFTQTDKGWTVKVQNTEKDRITCMNALTGEVKTKELDAPGIHEIWIAK